jgi:PAS domain S-box-containing protein
MNSKIVKGKAFSASTDAESAAVQPPEAGSIACDDLLMRYTEESFLIVDTHLKIVNVSHHFQKQYKANYGQELIRGKNILEFTPAHTKEAAAKRFREVLKGQSLEIESDPTLQQNTSFTCLYKYKPILDDKGKAMGVFVSLVNIPRPGKTDILYEPYRFIVENSPDAFFFSKINGAIIEANPAAVELFGYSLKEFRLINLNDITIENTRLFAGHISEWEQNEKMKGETIGIRKNGERFPFEFSSVLYKNPDKEPYVGTFVRDISLRKNDGKILELSEKRFRALIENATDIILLTDEKGNLKYASPAFARVTGFSTEEASLNPRLIVTQVHPDDLEITRKTYFEALERPGVPVSRLLRFCHKDGHYIWLEGVITNLMHDENVGAVVSNYRDISRRKAAEAKAARVENHFKALVENSEDIIILTDANGIVNYLSPAYEKLTGFSADEVIGQVNLAFMHPEQATETKGFFKRLLSVPGLSLPRTNRLKCKNGGYIWVEGHLTNLLDDENVQAIVSNYQDITERRQAAELIRQSETNLKTIFENTSEAFLLMDTRRIVKAFNTNARKIAFLNRNKELQSGFDVLDFIADDRQEMMRIIFDRVAAGEPVQYDRLYTDDEGKNYWIAFSIKPVTEDGQITGICIAGLDITARKLAEEELTARELRFRSILENSHDMLFLFDADGKVEFLSPAIEKVFGYTNNNEVIPQILESIHPEDFENAMQQLKVAFDSPDIPVYLSLRKKKRGGEYIWLEGTLTNLLHKPELHVIVANFRDVTERKQYEDQQALFVSIVNSSEDAIFSHTLDGTILSWNKGAVKLFGYSEAEAIGNNCSIIIPSKLLHEKANHIDSITRGISIEHFETQRRTKNGELIYVSLTVSPIRNSKGVITGASKVARDISDKKRSDDIIKNNEKRFRSLLQNSNDGLSLMTVEGVMLEISPTGKKITGFDETEMVGYARHDLIHPDDLEHVSQAFIDVIEDPGKTRNFEYRSLTKDGNYIWLEACCQNLLHEPTVGAIVINYRDITERKNQEMEREQLIRTLHQNNNDLRNFSYITSHNLKAPLSNLMGFINLLEDIPVEDQMLKSIIEGFKLSTMQLNHTINDLVKILIIRDNDSIEQKEVSFSRIFAQVKNQLRNLVDEVHPTFKINFDEAPRVFFNETYLESIFINLLTNAIKYRSFDRKLKIIIKTYPTANGAVLTFTDNGIGIDLERHRSKIFGLYQRFHDRPNSKGLGLYLIKSQMESLGGSIEVDSMLDIGTTFTLRFAGN